MKKLLANVLLGFSAVVVTLAPTVYTAYAADGNTFVNQQKPTDVSVAGGDLQNTGTGEPGLITTIKRGINLVLTFLGLIALVILLYGGFMMVTAAGDENKYKKGFTILRQSAIGLIFIGLSALFVNLIFWLIGTIA